MQEGGMFPPQGEDVVQPSQPRETKPSAVESEGIREQSLSAYRAPDAELAHAAAKSLSFIDPKLFVAIQKMAELFWKAEALPQSLDNQYKVIMALQAGFEAGLQPLESINSFAPINGKMTMYGDVMISQAIKRGNVVEFLEADGEKATCKITRGDNGATMTQTYTLQMAIRAGLTGKDNWKKYPERMLKYKAFAEVAHFLIPDALHGVGLAEEFEEYDDGMKTPTSPKGRKPMGKKVSRAEAARLARGAIKNGPSFEAAVKGDKSS